MKLRPYQEAAVKDTHSALEDSASAIGVAATGLGKTVMFAHIVSDFAKTDRVMVVAHREELIDQAASKIATISGRHVGVDMNVRHSGLGMFGREQIVVASVQTLGRGRMSKFDPKDFGLIVVDEAHHAVSPSYRSVIDYFADGGAKVFGVTATPDRLDERSMGQVFERAAFDYDVDFGVGESWLVPIRSRSVRVRNIDFSGVRTTAGDLNEADLAMIMEQEEALQEVATPTVDLVGSRRALVFAASVAHAEKLAEIFNRHRLGMADFVSGKTPKDVRKQKLADFAAGRTQIMVNVGVLTEGFDDPGIEVVVMARPTESRSLFAQMIGRGTRCLASARIDDHPHHADLRAQAIAASQKPCVEIIDFVGNSGEHSLVSVADILGGNYDPIVVARAKERAESDAIDVRQALEDEERMAAERARQDAAQRRAAIIAQVEYDTVPIDPFKVLGIRPIQARGWDRGKSVSPKMVELLQGYGVRDAHRLSYPAAKKLTAELFRRNYKGEPTLKQAATLQSLGSVVPKTRAEAGQLIEGIKREVGVAV
jgi:superfamily II DNA or RNA helicase